MKIELEIKDLKILLSALSIALRYIGKQVNAIEFGCEYEQTIVDLFNKYNIKTNEEDRQLLLLKERFNELKNIYNQLEENERKSINV